MPRSVTKAPAGTAKASGAGRKAPPRRGPVETAVREDVEQLGDLVGVEPSLSQMAYRLAQEIDAGGSEDGKQLAQLNRELRATLAALLEGRGTEDDDDDLADLDSPE